MAVSIRLSRIGKKNAPAFKIVVATKRDKLTGKYIDVLGHYNPSCKPISFDIDKEKYTEWVSKGALPSKAVQELVDGTYEFKHYTRQNEETKEKVKEAPDSNSATEKGGAKTEGAKEDTKNNPENTNDNQSSKEKVSEVEETTK